jgi:hypothetical protein
MGLPDDLPLYAAIAATSSSATIVPLPVVTVVLEINWKRVAVVSPHS